MYRLNSPFANLIYFPESFFVPILNANKIESTFLQSLFIIIYLFWMVLSLCCYTGFFSSCFFLVLSSCSAQTSHCCGSFCCREQALSTWALVIAAYGLNRCGSWGLERMLSNQQQQHMGWFASWHVGSSQIRNGTHVACIGTEPPGESLE